MSLTLSLNAVSAAATNKTTADISAQDEKVNTSTTTTINSQQTSTTDKTTTSSLKTDSTRYEGTPDSGAQSTSSTIKYAAGAAKTIKVLIYSGSEASTNCVNGIIKALDYANSNGVIAGVIFSYATSTKITSTILSGYDVLAMPGGSGGYYYLNSGSISGSAIKDFVASGKGYIGICAGAYSAAAHTDNYYDGWGIAPNVKAKAVSYIGNLAIQITSAGEQVLGTSGTKTISHYNGAAMYVSGNAVTFATYADSKTGYKGYAAIVGDYYGKGRVVLSGPHPELSLNTVPTFVSKLIYWAAGTSSSTTTTPTVTISQVANTASNVKSFYEKNKRLPNYVTINSQQVSMPKFLYLLTTATTQINSGSITASISLRSVNSPSKISGTIKAGNILKSEYLTKAQSIANFIKTNGRAPNFMTIKLGNMSYTKIIYFYSQILNYYRSNGKLPSYISMK